MRQIAAVRPRIGQQLVLLVELLRRRQRLFRGKAQLRVRLALERRQIIQERWPHALVFPSGLRHPCRPAGNALRDLLRGLLVFELTLAFLVDIHALIVAEIRTHRVKRLGHKCIDFPPPLDEHAQRRRLHTADGEQHIVTDRIGARRVHADEPVRVRPTARAGIERIVICRRPKAVKPGADGLVRHGGYPQPLHRLSAPRLLVNIAEDQLALAPGVRRADDILRFLVVHPFFDGEKLASRLFDHLCLHLFRQNRQIFRAPSGISFVQLLRLFERNQMSECPRDHIAAADQAVFAPVLCAQHAGNIPRDGGFFGNDERMHGFTSCFFYCAAPPCWRLAKRVYCPSQASFTVPSGPLRCLATITSAMFLSSVLGS